MARYNCKEPTTGKLDDCTKGDLADLQAEDKSELEEDCESKTGSERHIFQ